MLAEASTTGNETLAVKALNLGADPNNAQSYGGFACFIWACQDNFNKISYHPNNNNNNLLPNHPFQMIQELHQEDNKLHLSHRCEKKLSVVKANQVNFSWLPF